MKRLTLMLLLSAMCLAVLAGKPIPKPNVTINIVADKQFEFLCSNRTGPENEVTLTAEVIGTYTGPLIYQWTEDGNPIAGEVFNTILLKKSTPQRHFYSCYVQDTAYPEPIIFTDPDSFLVIWEICPKLMWWMELK